MKVKFHTNLKHRFLGTYLSISVQAQKKHRRPIYFVDLFCGDGKAEIMHECPNWDETSDCSCKEFQREDPERKKWCRWNGSPLIGLKWAKRAEYDFHCIFNDYDEQVLQKLKDRISPPNPYVKKIFHKDANDVYESILQMLPKQAQNFFSLDPYNYTQLQWKTVKTIATHATKEWRPPGKFIMRRPELMINLPTSTMQQAYHTDKGAISQFFGIDKSTLRKEVQKDQVKGIPMYKTFLRIYSEKLENIYKEEPEFIEIRQVGKGRTKGEGPPVYYLLFIASLPTVMDIFEKSVKRREQNYASSFSQEWYTLKGFKSMDEYL